VSVAKKPPAKKPAPRTKAGTGKDAAARRRHLFVEAYIANGGNATEAAKTAGYSAKTAGQQGHMLLKDVEVSRALADRQQKLAAKFEITTEAVLRNLAQAIHFDPRKLVNEDGSAKAIQELDDDTAMALSGFEVTEEFIGRGEDRELSGYTKKFKWLDKNTARDQAMKHLGMFREDNDQRNPLAGLPRETLKALAAKLGARG